MKEPTIAEFEDARVLLHGQGIDLIFGVTMWTLFSKKSVAAFPEFLDGLQIPAARLYLSHILLTLCKVAETYKRYRYLLPEPERSALKEVFSFVNERKIGEFRNKVIGHVWDKDTGRPLSPEIIDKRITEIIPDRVQFFTSLLNLADANDPTTVVGKLKGASGVLKKEIGKKRP